MKNWIRVLVCGPDGTQELQEREMEALDETPELFIPTTPVAAQTLHPMSLRRWTTCLFWQSLRFMEPETMQTALKRTTRHSTLTIPTAIAR